MPDQQAFAARPRNGPNGRGASAAADPVDDAFARAAAMLVDRASRPLAFVPQFRPLQTPAAPPPSVVAVDGSHAVLADGAVWVVAHRAAAVAWPAPARADVAVAVDAVIPNEASDLVETRYAAASLPAPRVDSAESLADALRSLDELHAALAAVAGLPGTLLLWDGALEGLPPAPQAIAARLRDAARARHVHVVGVAKRSALSMAGAPLLPALHRLGESCLPGKAWQCALPGHTMARAARLHGRAPFAFRVDAASDADVASLLPLSRDAAYIGYPYPLARAHNAVALTGAHKQQLKSRLESAVRQHGGPAAWAMLADFHETLDRNVPG